MTVTSFKSKITFDGGCNRCIALAMSVLKVVMIRILRMCVNLVSILFGICIEVLIYYVVDRDFAGTFEASVYHLKHLRGVQYAYCCIDN